MSEITLQTFNISQQSIQWVLRFFSLDQSSGLTNQLTDQHCHPVSMAKQQDIKMFPVYMVTHLNRFFQGPK